jgi:murein DD-endopeptidase MepM/ murein hydrolase activator NlpD
VRLLIERCVEAARRRPEPARPLLVVAVLVAASVVATAATDGHIEAAAPTPSQSLPASAFEPVTVPDADPIQDPPTPRASPPVAAATPAATLAPTPPAEPVTVIRFRPRNGGTGVSRFADVSVRFSAPMDRAVTQAAFHATIGKSAVSGRFRWAERDTVLVLNPSDALPYGATVDLSVDAGATATDGVALEAPAGVSFVVQPKPPSPTPSPPHRAPRPSAWQWPLIGPITQYFGQTLTKYGVHQGIDIDGDTGDPVKAARAGRVVVAGYADACGGLQVRIDHGDGFTSWYRHLSRVLVRVGDRVPGGTVIGRVGATGCATGSHLHFGIQKGSTFVDPMTYLPHR